MAPIVGPCDWTADHTGHSADDLAEWNALPLNIRTLSDAYACLVLWAATGRKFDACELTVRPILACTHESVMDLYASGDAHTYMGAGEWLDYPANSTCCVRINPKVAVLEPPVNEVVQVLVDGVVVPPASYRVDEDTRLVRVDGLAWPVWQDVATDNAAVGAFTVTYTVGLPIPTILEQMAGILALEVARALSGSSACRLPSRATELIRQGVTVSLTDPTWILEHGFTGITEVDLAIRMYNPTGQAAPSQAYIPQYYPTRVG